MKVRRTARWQQHGAGFRLPSGLLILADWWTALLDVAQIPGGLVGRYGAQCGTVAKLQGNGPSFFIRSVVRTVEIHVFDGNVEALFFGRRCADSVTFSSR